jgi:hypothetical protein
VTRASHRRFVIAATAAAGLFAGHGLDYFVSFPTRGLRHAALHATGHGYLFEANAAAIGAGVLGLAAAALLAFRLGRTGDDTRVLGWRATFVRLAVSQMAAFAALEITERLLAGAPLGRDLLPLLGVGLLLQVAVAAVGAGVVVLVSGAAHALGRALAARLRPARSRSFRLPRAADVASRLGSGSRRTRAPPVLLAA